MIYSRYIEVDIFNNLMKKKVRSKQYISKDNKVSLVFNRFHLMNNIP